MALATGIIKVAVGIHYPSDVLVGALIGEAAALGVSWLHAAPSPAPGKPAISAAPGAVSLHFVF